MLAAFNWVLTLLLLHPWVIVATAALLVVLAFVVDEKLK